MTTHLTAMATALAVRNACARQIDKDRPLDNLDLDAIVRRVIQSVAQCLPCADDVFDGIAQAIQAQSHCTPFQAFSQVLDMVDPARPLDYSPWRHGGWYVSAVRYSRCPLTPFSIAWSRVPIAKRCWTAEEAE